MLSCRKEIKKKEKKTAISTEQRLLITLRYLATGDDILSIAIAYRIGRSTLRNVIIETCICIHNALAPIYTKLPNKQIWKNISAGFMNDWNIPNCIGAVNSKHVVMRAPPNSGSRWFDYKKHFSMSLFAVCKNRYEFTIFDIGALGSESDGGIFMSSEFGKALQNGNLNLPEPEFLPRTNLEVPFYFVGDGAFELSTNFMRPYKGSHLDDNKRIFNYRLSRGRRCIENAFGILVSRWKVFAKPIAFHPRNTKIIILAGVSLHKFLMARTQKTVRNLYCPRDYLDQEDESGNIIVGTWRHQVGNSSIFYDLKNVCDLKHLSNCQATERAYKMREILTRYFVSPVGEVPWQKEYIYRGRNQDL